MFRLKHNTLIKNGARSKVDRWWVLENGRTKVWDTRISRFERAENRQKRVERIREKRNIVNRRIMMWYISNRNDTKKRSYEIKTQQQTMWRLFIIYHKWRKNKHTNENSQHRQLQLQNERQKRGRQRKTIIITELSLIKRKRSKLSKRKRGKHEKINKK